MDPRRLALAAALLVPPSLVRAEEALPVTRGSHVRVSATSFAGKLDGRVESIDGALLTLRSGDRSVVAVPLGTVTRLEVAAGRRRHTGTGALIGAGLGALGILALCAGEVCIQSSEDVGAALAVVAAPAACGALFGALIKSDRWIVIPTRPRGAGLGPEPRPRLAAGLAIGFSF